MFALIGYSQERLLYVYLQTFLTFNQSKLNSCIVQDIRFFVDRFITYLAYNMRGLKCKSHPVTSYHFHNHKEGNLICEENHLKKSTRKSNMAAPTWRLRPEILALARPEKRLHCKLPIWFYVV